MIAEGLTYLRETTLAILFSPGSVLSLWSLLAAFLIASGVAIARRRGRSVRAKALLRAMFPRRMWNASTRADIGFTVFGVFASAVALGWAIVSHLAIADAVTRLGSGATAAALPAWLVVALTTVALWLAYEFAYFLDHMLSHRIPWLWAFHKVHHTAETLSPLTIFRVHPVDSIVFYNIVAVMTGLTAGAMRLLLGDTVAPMTVAGTNVLLLATILTIKHLHHSHVWIAFTGPLGRILISPAHHQLHHSIAPEHHDRNFGETLAVFDWLYGSLCVPTAARQPLRFGVEGVHAPHTAHATVVQPFADALATLPGPMLPTPRNLLANPPTSA